MSIAEEADYTLSTHCGEQREIEAARSRVKAETAATDVAAVVHCCSLFDCLFVCFGCVFSLLRLLQLL